MEYEIIFSRYKEMTYNMAVFKGRKQNLLSTVSGTTSDDQNTDFSLSQKPHAHYVIEQPFL